MRRITTLCAIGLAAIIGFSSCQPKEQKVYIASLNDMHANIDNFPKLAFVVDSLRTLYPDMLLFAAGDNRSGNPINDRYSEPARPMVELMNKVGFNLSCFGNHEWDSGLDALRNVMNIADFPYVCANVQFDDSLNIPVKPYTIIEYNGLKLAVIGGIQLGLNGLPDFHPDRGAGAHFRPIEEVLPDYLFLRDECDALFLLSHCGFEGDIDIAEQFPQLDAIFGGHTHTLVEDTKLFNNVMVTQAQSKVKYLTLSTFTFDKKGKMIAKESQVISILNASGVNEEVKAMVDEFNNNDVFAQIMGNNEAAIEDCYECFGCLMCDADKECTGAQLAFQNYGGVRYDTLSARPITLKDIFSLDPFDNELIIFMMTGQEIIDLLSVSFFTDHGPNYCSGCTYSYSVDEEGQMTDCKVVLEDGTPLDMNATYSVVMNSYMSSAFDFAHEDPGTSTFRTSNEALVSYLANHQNINYANASRVTEK